MRVSNSLMLAGTLTGLAIIFFLYLSWRNFWWEYAVNDVPLETNTVCLGHYDLEVPKAFNMRFESVALNGFTVTNLNVSNQQQLQTQIDMRRRSLEAGVFDDALGETSTLRWQRQFDDAQVLAIDQSYDLPGLTSEGYLVEAYVIVGQISMRLEGFLTFAQEDVQLDLLRKVTSGLRAGQGPGFCLDGAHFPGKVDAGFATVVFQDPELERYNMTVSVAAGARARGAIDAESNASPLARSRDIAGEPGYEVRVVSDEVSQNEHEVMIRFSARAGRAAAEGSPFAQMSFRLSKDAKSADAPPYTVPVSAQIWELALSSIRRRAQ